ncbi:MAG: thiaminase II [Chloroflexi bacterium]|nr:thiaminase II [Chloroflexota bacterium]
MMRFSDTLREHASKIWEREHQHPFVVELGDGTLPLQKFQWYMKQDYLFLIEFSRVIALAVAKAETLEDMGWFARLLHETLNTEMSLHVSFCEDFGNSESDLLATRLSPTTLAYTDHMIANAHSGTIAEVAATLLPCSWGYAEIGQALEAHGKPTHQPLYCRWIEMYSSPEFGELAEWLRSFIDRTALGLSDAKRERLIEIFVTNSNYEYLFWDAAYRMEDWPV